MRNTTDQPVTGDDLFGRESEIQGLWQRLEEGLHVLMLGPRCVGKSSILRTLWRRPVRDWDVIYADMGDCSEAGDCVAVLLGAFVQHPAFRPWMRRIAFRRKVAQTVEAAEKGMLPTLVRPTLRKVMEADWPHAAERLQIALGRLPDRKRRLVVVLDDLPLAIARMAAGDNVDALGRWLVGTMRDRHLEGHVRFLIGGSGGLGETMHRSGLTARENRIIPFPVAVWNSDTAADFLLKLGEACGLVLEPVHIAAILGALDDPVPMHLQLVYAVLHEACAGNPSHLSAEAVRAAIEHAIEDDAASQPLLTYAQRLAAVLPERDMALARFCLARLCPHAEGMQHVEMVPREYGGERHFPMILHYLVEDGYILDDGERLRFRSELLRRWWQRTQVHG